MIAELCKAGLERFELGGIEPNPRIDSVRKGAKLCKQEKIDAILAVGGGSVIDAAKFIGAAPFTTAIRGICPRAREKSPRVFLS